MINVADNNAPNESTQSQTTQPTTQSAPVAPVKIEPQQQQYTHQMVGEFIEATGPITSATTQAETDPRDNMGIQPPKLSQLMQRVHQSASMSTEGEAYFDKLLEIMASDQVRHEMPIRTQRLATPAGAVAIYCKDNVIILAPSETLNIPQDVPRTVVLKAALDCYHSTVHAGDTLLMSLIITPHDYSKLTSMTTCILNCFRAVCFDEFKHLSVNSLSDDYFVVNTNTNDTINYMKSRYPHTVQPRTDMGFLLCVTPKDRHKYYHDQQRVNYFDQGNTDTNAIAAVTAFTDVFKSNATTHGMPRFGTSVRITSMMSDIPVFAMTAILLPLAADVFIRAGLWRNQFSVFEKGTPNIGRLFKDYTTNQFIECTTPAMRDQLMENYVDAPGLSLDVQEGTYRIPGIEKYALPNSSDDILVAYANFLGTAVPNITVGKYYLHEYTGVINQNGKLSDSRWADYLSTMVHWESDANAVSSLLVHIQDPKIRAEQIRRFYPSLEVYYSNFLASIDLTFMGKIIMLIRDKIKLSQNHTLGIDNTVDLSFIVQDGLAFKQAGVSFMYGSGGNYYGNPFSAVYR